MGRPSTQEQRRDDILRSTIALLERHDMATLRIVDVAREMGLTANAVRYYFKDIDALLSELALRSDKRFNDDRRARNATTDDPRQQLTWMIEAGLPTGPEDAEWRSIWRAVLAAGFELDERTDVQAILHRQVALYTAVLEAGAIAECFDLAYDPADIAMTLMSMEDYLGYRIAARDPQIGRADALRLMRNYAETATGATLPS